MVDSQNMLENLIQILNSIQVDISKRFEKTSKNLPKIQEIFAKNFETIINYFVRCLQHIDLVKSSSQDNLFKGLTQLNEMFKSEIEVSKFGQNDILGAGNKNSNLVFDEEFVSLINSLSGNIKDFMKTKTFVYSIPKP